MSYRRIACLSTEVVETLYLLGAEDRIAGISGYTVRPARARKEKPKISGFTSAKLERILAVEPDLVIAFSDLQADIVRDLIRSGIEAHVFNQRDITGILRMISNVAAMVDKQEEGEKLTRSIEDSLAAARVRAALLTKRPRIYFEEWGDPMISGIRWVSELIEAAGGEDCFAELSHHAKARDRIIADSSEVARRAPDIIIGSWCGRKFQPEQVAVRPGWDRIPAVQLGQLYEIKSADILSPGPALIDGLAHLEKIIGQWTVSHDGTFVNKA